VNKKEAAKAADQARPAAALDVAERQPGDDLEEEDYAQFDG
jgi:hypothetical protein